LKSTSKRGAFLFSPSPSGEIFTPFVFFAAVFLFLRLKTCFHFNSTAMRNFVSLSVFLVLFLASQGILAQKQWTIQECIEYALNNNLQYKLSALAVNFQENTLQQAKNNRLPTLNGQASHSYNYGRSIDPFTNQFINQAVQSNVFGAQADVTLFNAFSITNTIKQAQHDLAATKYDLEKSKNDMVLGIFNAYLQILLNKELLENSKIQIKTLNEQIERTEKLVKAGAAAEAVLFDLLSQRANNELQIVNADNAVMLSKLSLKQLLMLSDGEDFDIQTPELPEIKQSVFSTPSGIYEAAESNMPEIKAADTRIHSARLGIKIASANFYPRLSMSGSIFTNYSSAQKKYFKAGEGSTLVNREIGFLKNDPSQIVVQPVYVPNGEIVDFTYAKQLRESFRQNWGFTLTIPIFNRFSVRNAVANANLQVRRAELNAQVVRNQLRQNIEQAYTDARAALATYEANMKRLEALRLSKENAERRFGAGVMNVTDYNIALNNYNAAVIDLSRSKYQYIFRVKVLDFYEGKEIKF
jgi:outer membrane protein